VEAALDAQRLNACGVDREDPRRQVDESAQRGTTADSGDAMRHGGGWARSAEHGTRQVTARLVAANVKTARFERCGGAAELYDSNCIRA